MRQFIQCVGGSSSIYGFCEETLDSLFLTVLPVGSEPPLSMGIKLPLHRLTSTDAFKNEQEKHTYILQVLTEALRQHFKFRFQQVSDPTFHTNGCCVVLGCFSYSSVSSGRNDP